MDVSHGEKGPILTVSSDAEVAALTVAIAGGVDSARTPVNPDLAALWRKVSESHRIGDVYSIVLAGSEVQLTIHALNHMVSDRQLQRIDSDNIQRDLRCASVMLQQFEQSA